MSFARFSLTGNSGNISEAPRKEHQKTSPFREEAGQISLRWSLTQSNQPLLRAGKKGKEEKPIGALHIVTLLVSKSKFLVKNLKMEGERYANAPP
ncbi:MAG: hypothetical protein Q8P39_02750 [Candidatus Yanofskybacteria bacterium]|nr:hypothetical protein [Candidatus Yanofskybacteria bacterium]